MDIQRNVELAQFSSFKVGGKADYFFEANSRDEAVEALSFARAKNLPVTILGGGSNILISDKGISGLVILVNIKGIKIIDQNFAQPLLEIGAGELWDDAVAFAAANNLWGIENMSAIPGRVGAFASGNVGAYGQEAAQVLQSVEALNIKTGENKTFSNPDMQFAYRKSILNTVEKGNYVITTVTLRLQKEPNPNLSYKDVQKYFEKQQTAVAGFQPSIKEIREAIIAIRQAKLPEPKIIGNAGSFFKNIFVDDGEFKTIQETVKKNFGQEAADKISFQADGSARKISAAYLIELCGLKGWSVGGAQIYPKHSLIIVNTGNATAGDILNLAKHIRQEVFAKTLARLTPEPIFLGYSELELQEFYDLT
jgi:UDP-N-acetylmuramate dehydrogenase